MKILFLIPYPLKESPSQRFRFEQYTEVLIQAGHTVRSQSFLNSHNWSFFFKSGHFLHKGSAVFSGFIKRLTMLLIVAKYDFVFIHRETLPIGFPVFEWMIAKIWRKKIIYDFDDAIWLTDLQDESSLMRLLKWRQKVKTICRLSYKVSCGNHYLQDYAKQYNSQVIYNPTTLDCEHWHNPDLHKISKQAGQVVIGWTGSHSTLKYLTLIEPVLKKIQNQFPFVSFLIIADQPPPIKLERLSFLTWNPHTEIEDLLNIDIGIMPLPDDEWAKGKCGFKALQYMALKIPAIASPVGVNPEIIDHTINGYLAATEHEWYNYLSQLIINPTLRINMGIAGRQKVVRSYSVSSNTANFLSLFE
ncbi:MAG: glycosyltransferase family 4 protein [Cyclobacteriaceae bacterium]|nr:glycosyltransferase family 4 protein [Cyclobacteriaceae bacterium]